MSILHEVGEVVTELKCRHCDSQMPDAEWIKAFGGELQVVARDEYGYWSWNCGCNGEAAFCHLVATKPHGARCCNRLGACGPEGSRIAGAADMENGFGARFDIERECPDCRAVLDATNWCGSCGKRFFEEDIDVDTRENRVIDSAAPGVDLRWPVPPSVFGSPNIDDAAVLKLQTPGQLASDATYKTLPVLPKANEGSWEDACAGCGYLPQHCECD